MDTTGTTDTKGATSPVRGALTYFMGALAFLTCPCHLAILVLVLSGTATGAFLKENFVLAVVLLLPVFLLSAFATWRLLDKSDSDKPIEYLPRGPQLRDGAGGSRAAEP